jgi:hypothetical protein
MCIVQNLFHRGKHHRTRPHGYLVIDMKQNTPDIIFPGEEQKAYVES